MEESISSRIINIIAEQAFLEVSDITLESTFEDLGIDSLGVAESVFAIEESFDIQIPFDANSHEQSELEITSVRSIIEVVEKLLTGRDT